MTPKKQETIEDMLGPDPAHVVNATPFLALPMQVRLAYYGVATPGAAAPILWGMPGTAKTTFASLIAKALGMHFITVLFSDRAPEDIGGTPMPVGDEMRRYPPDFAREAANIAATGKKVLILADEVTTVPPPVQAPLLRFTLERVCGDLALDPVMVRLMCAANPVEQAANGQEVAHALASRLQHVPWSPLPVEMWSENEMGGGVSDIALPSFPEEEWRNRLPEARARIAAFLRSRPSAYAEDPMKAEGRGHGQFASPRGWSKFALVRAAALALRDTEAILPLAIGLLGEPVAIEFATWERKHDLPDAEDVLSGKVKFTHDEKRPDRTFAVLMAVAAIATTEKPAKEFAARWSSAWTVLGAVLKDGVGKDFVATAARTLAKKRPAGGVLRDDVQKVIASLSGIVREAGLS